MFIDTFIGIIPILGDILDNLFKSNLRNLTLLENWLLTDAKAGRYRILLMPDGDTFLPKGQSRFGKFFSGNGKRKDEERMRDWEAGGRRTRRMWKDEGVESEPLD